MALLPAHSENVSNKETNHKNRIMKNCHQGVVDDPIKKIECTNAIRRSQPLIPTLDGHHKKLNSNNSEEQWSSLPDVSLRTYI